MSLGKLFFPFSWLRRLDGWPHTSSSRVGNAWSLFNTKPPAYPGTYIEVAEEEPSISSGFIAVRTSQHKGGRAADLQWRQNGLWWYLLSSGSSCPWPHPGLWVTWAIKYLSRVQSPGLFSTIFISYISIFGMPTMFMVLTSDHRELINWGSKYYKHERLTEHADGCFKEGRHQCEPKALGRMWDLSWNLNLCIIHISLLFMKYVRRVSWDLWFRATLTHICSNKLMFQFSSHSFGRKSNFLPHYT